MRLMTQLQLQTLDMNQDFYLEEAFKLPNALQFIGRRKEVTGRLVASVGLREHIFSCYDGAPALFMSQGMESKRLLADHLVAPASCVDCRRVCVRGHVAANDGFTLPRSNALRASRHVGQGASI